MDDRTSLLQMASTIVAAYVANNTVPPAELPKLLSDTYRALQSIAAGAETSTEAPAALKPAVNIKKSVTPEYIVCLEDGKKFKSLKRHLRSHYNLSPEQYREKWGLPADYPMVAPNYATTRSNLARRMGLGKRSD